ncbi:MAG TPA: glycosyltransferase family 39 protein [Vicinamibacterales bacterium]|nr:glycosyltransferase family 39 protein [Vicinamibacterales bacterium]
MKRRTGREAAAVLVTIVALAAALRLWAVSYGLPAIFNPDEIPILSRALAFAKGDLNPHNFLYPTLYFYALFVWETLYFVVGRVAGLYHSVADFQNAFFVDPSRLVLVGRTLTAAFGVASVVAVYEAGRRFFDRQVGIGAALFLAVAPFAVRDAHYVKLDVPTAFFVTLAYAALARLVVGDPGGPASRPWSWVLAGYIGGLAMASHYYALFICVPFAAAAVIQGERTGNWRAAAGLLLAAALGTIAGFVTGCPFFFVEPRTAMRDIAGVRQVDIDRAVGSAQGAFPTLDVYFHMLWTDAIGWPVFAASLLGLATAGWRRSLVLVSFPVAFLAFIGHTVPESRYLNVLLPVIAVAGAAGVVWTLRRLRAATVPATAAAFLLCATPGLLLSARSDRFFLMRDTRALAADYIVEHVAPGASILIQPYSAPLARTRESIIEALRRHLGSETSASIKFQLQLSATPYPSPAYRLIYLGDGGDDPDKIYVSPRAFHDDSLTPILTLGVDYVVLKRYNIDNPALGPLESALRQHATLVTTVSPYRADASAAERAATAPFLHNTAARIQPALERPGPIVDVWQIK